MRRLMTWATAAALPGLMAAMLAVGCSGNATTGGGSTGGGTGGGSGKGTGGKLSAVEATGKATVKGKVTFTGAKPDLAKMTADLVKQMEEKKEPHCLAADAKPFEKEQFTWRIGEGGALANVFVWVAPPKGKFFKIEEKDLPKNIKDPVILDQPHCAFIPHAFVLFPKYRDSADKEKETGQTLVVKNSADMLHNTKIVNPDNPEIDKAVPSKGQWDPLTLNPSAAPINFSCSVHTWMRAYAWAFDHPYAAVTKEDGTYEIANVPAGAEVHVVVWHEEAKFVKGKEGEKVTLKDGETKEMNFEVKAP